MKEPVKTEQAPSAIGPYSQGVRAGALIVTSGQLGADPVTGALREGVEAQTKQALENCRAVLRAAGADLSNVVKTTVFLHDMQDFAAMNAVYAGFFPDCPPARSAVQVARLPKDGLVEIECLAVL